ncbi:MULTISPECIES: DUF6400 family protein [unclassified Streptomyces]|uniref:DUF6400 family protein n=1 Tax=unclassified Streptomyces TaxID=2593676 RepID=UPI003330ED76
MIHDQTPDLHEFEMDLTHDEVRRRAAVLHALGDDWDPLAVLAGEQEAYRQLYSNLDAEQQETYDRLVAAGVLPGGEGEGRAAA